MSIGFSPRVLHVVYSLDELNMLFSHQKKIVESLLDTNPNAQIISINDKKHLGEKIVAGARVWSINWVPGQTFFNLLKFYTIILSVMLRFRPKCVFVHMADLHCLLLAPLAKIVGCRIYLWYAHKNFSTSLFLVQPFLTGIFTSTKDSCPIKSKKVRIVGQAISEDEFEFVGRKLPLRKAVYLGRLDRIKGIGQIVEEVERSLQSCLLDSIDFFGAPSNGAEKDWFDKQLSVFKMKYPWFEDSLRGPIKRNELNSVLKTYDIFFNAYRGSLDKVLIEATMLGIPVVTLNVEYANEFSLDSEFFTQSLFDQVKSYSSLNQAELDRTLKLRREIAISKHGLRQWVEKVSSVINEN